MEYTFVVCVGNDLMVESWTMNQLANAQFVVAILLAVS